MPRPSPSSPTYSPSPLGPAPAPTSCSQVHARRAIGGPAWGIKELLPGGHRVAGPRQRRRAAPSVRLSTIQAPTARALGVGEPLSSLPPPDAGGARQPPLQRLEGQRAEAGPASPRPRPAVPPTSHSRGCTCKLHWGPPCRLTPGPRSPPGAQLPAGELPGEVTEGHAQGDRMEDKGALGLGPPRTARDPGARPPRGRTGGDGSLTVPASSPRGAPPGGSKSAGTSAGGCSPGHGPRGPTDPPWTQPPRPLPPPGKNARARAAPFIARTAAREVQAAPAPRRRRSAPWRALPFPPRRPRHPPSSRRFGSGSCGCRAPGGVRPCKTGFRGPCLRAWRTREAASLCGAPGAAPALRGVQRGSARPCGTARSRALVRCGRESVSVRGGVGGEGPGAPRPASWAPRPLGPKSGQHIGPLALGRGCPPRGTAVQRRKRPDLEVLT